jgi:hypothetical protein
MSVRVTYGVNNEMKNDVFVDKTVSEVRGLVSGLLNIPTDVTPTINGKAADESSILRARD